MSKFLRLVTLPTGEKKILEVYDIKSIHKEGENASFVGKVKVDGIEYEVQSGTPHVPTRQHAPYRITKRIK